jgi:Pyruvate/2-oxoacid:ferredoxin oxidoreductase delta subunit
MVSRKIAEVAKDECVACGTCAAQCPRGAISIRFGVFAAVDETRCAGCGLCAKLCPASVIRIKEAPQ